jgi:hypothetical protein
MPLEALTACSGLDPMGFGSGRRSTSGTRSLEAQTERFGKGARPNVGGDSCERNPLGADAFGFALGANRISLPLHLPVMKAVFGFRACRSPSFAIRDSAPRAVGSRSGAHGEVQEAGLSHRDSVLSRPAGLYCEKAAQALHYPCAEGWDEYSLAHITAARENEEMAQ